ncbi:tRNA dihydrouridine synthase DusB [Anaerovibrio sp.]|uniref:tRNA dihydrouridine synthase DusB n=1 Tax=Anaerovibrio sp. TaxID=1872532 RepID=UPI003F18DD40
MRIGSFEFEYPVFLAPMAGVTDTPYRILAREMGCPLVYSEMVSDKGINYRNEHTLNMLKTEPEERPMAMQLFGAEADSVARAAEYVAGLGCADILDFNMGCPAPKVVKNHEGSAMLKNPENAYRVLKALVGAVDMPVTVKLRIGWDEKSINIMEMAQLAQEAGVAAVAIHGRTREQFYRDQADWKIIGRVRESLRIPVIANGDVRSVQDLAKIRQVTGCEAVMVGRAAQGNPWIFRQLTEYLKTGAVLPGPTIEERKEVIIRHLDMLLKFKGDYIGPREMRKHATWYTRGIKGSAELRCLFNQAVCRDDFLRVLEKMK